MAKMNKTSAATSDMSIIFLWRDITLYDNIAAFDAIVRAIPKAQAEHDDAERDRDV